jgi:putative tricarboxylic transport membrane protein
VLQVAASADPPNANEFSTFGGGDLLTALLGKKITVGTSSPGELIDQIEAGQLRALAVSGEERVEGVDAPTLKESGIDLTFANWRGVLAPPGISEKDKQAMVKALEEMHGTPQWKEALVKNGWTDAFMTGADFERFLKDQDNRVSSTLTELGLV